jgi:hypothetical protein
MEPIVSVEERKHKGKKSNKSRKRSNPVEPEPEIASVDVTDDVDSLKVAEIDGNKEKKIEKLRKALKNDLVDLKVELHQMLHQDLVSLVDQSSETRSNSAEKQFLPTRSHSLDSTASEPASSRALTEIITLNVGGVVRDHYLMYSDSLYIYFIVIFYSHTLNPPPNTVKQYFIFSSLQNESNSIIL